MANSIGWGEGSINNSIDWGKGASNSVDSWGLIQSQSWSGETNIVGGGIFAGLLDTYPNAEAAYSLRNLSSATIGSPVIRVRRASDNTEQNFTSTEITDGTLETFCSATNGFVTTWYDQSGNVRNISSAVASYQPQIVSNGVVYSDNGHPFVYYNGVNQYGLLVSGLPWGTYWNLWTTYYGYASQVRHCILNQDGSRAVGIVQQGSTAVANLNMGNPSYYKNNALITNTRANLYNELQIANYTLVRIENIYNHIGRIRPHAWDSTQNYWNGACKTNEFIIYPTSQTEIQGIEDNINAEYSIY